MAAKEKFAEPTYLECGFGELEYKVIKSEICCRCGTCEAFCPRIEHVENKPALVNYDPPLRPVLHLLSQDLPGHGSNGVQALRPGAKCG